jgi:hypothetical protein
MIDLLRQRETVSRRVVLSALHNDLNDPVRECRAPAIIEAIARIEGFLDATEDNC